MTQAHPDDDALVELALGAATAPDALSAHLRDCAECRAAYDDVTRDMEVALVRHPRSRPRPASRAASSADSPAPRGPPPPPCSSARRAGGRRRRRPGGGHHQPLGLQSVLDDRHRRTRSRCAPTTAASSAACCPAALTTRTCSSCASSTAPRAHYVCRLRLDDDSTMPAGDWVVPDSGTATWITPSDPDAASIELVTDTGKVWSSASLG